LIGRPFAPTGPHFIHAGTFSMMKARARVASSQRGTCHPDARPWSLTGRLPPA
jgi:hypothetical protein